MMWFMNRLVQKKMSKAYHGCQWKGKHINVIVFDLKQPELKFENFYYTSGLYMSHNTGAAIWNVSFLCFGVVFGHLMIFVLI